MVLKTTRHRPKLNQRALLVALERIFKKGKKNVAELQQGEMSEKK